MNSEISIVNVKPQLVLGMRKRGPYQNIAVMIPQICQFAAQNGIQMIGPPMFICHETSAEEAMKARAALGIQPGSFALRLIGKDGAIKLSAETATPMMEIYALIDSMPMRQREKAERSYNNVHNRK